MSAVDFLERFSPSGLPTAKNTMHICGIWYAHAQVTAKTKPRKQCLSKYIRMHTAKDNNAIISPFSGKKAKQVNITKVESFEL